MKLYPFPVLILFSLFTFSGLQSVKAQTDAYKTVQLNVGEEHQTIIGFGASLAYYEGWLTAHPNRAEIYDVIFGELSLDILRVRNAHGYDATMIDRVKQFAAAAEKSLGHPIDIMSTSWGTPAYLKSNNDKNNGGTLKYEVVDDKVEFNYAGFAAWWNESLDEYNSNGIYPKYISIQNEPDWKASYESCLLRPSETINSTDTLAGYNKALQSFFNTLMQLVNPPVFLDPEASVLVTALWRNILIPSIYQNFTEWRIICIMVQKAGLWKAIHLPHPIIRKWGLSTPKYPIFKQNIPGATGFLWLV